jgi:hypothetical protein
MPTVRDIKQMSVSRLLAIDGVEMAEVESIGIYIPLNDGKMDGKGANLETTSSLHMESWRYQMNEEINLINGVLPAASCLEKAEAIQD